MKSKIALALLAGFFLQLCGCASIIEVRLPEKYKEKKLTEDPPTSPDDEKTLLDNQK